MPVPDCMQHQVQRDTRSITQELPAGRYGFIEPLEVRIQLFPVASVQVELVLHGSRCFCKQFGRVNGIRAVEFLPQVALYPRQIVFQDAGVFGCGCKCLD